MKKNFLVGLAAISLACSSQGWTSQEECTQSTASDLHHTFTTECVEDGAIHREVWEQEKQKKLSEALQEVSLYIRIDDLEGTPFYGKRRMISPTWWNLLWESQAETLLLQNGIQKTQKERYTAGDVVEIPLKYPDAAAYFPDALSDLLKLPAFNDFQQIKSDQVVVVSSCENGNNILGYYEHWLLKMATYVSLGTLNTKTISGQYPLTLDSVYRRSRKYQNAAMPYAIHIKGGYFLHQGPSNGKPRSHGCIRVPGLYQKWLYERFKESTSSEGKLKPIIILEGLYDKALSRER